MKNVKLQALSERIADDLFVNGSQEEAQRLVLTVDKPVRRDLGGWSKRAVIDRIYAILVADPRVVPATEGEPSR